MARPLILAYGNSLRGDDGVAFSVLEHVTGESEPVFNSISEPQLDLELSEAVAESSLVVFIDASVVGEPGSVDLRWIEPDPNAVGRTHDCTPAALLAYTAAVHGSAPRAALVTVVGREFGFSETLSDAAQSGVPEASRLVRELLRDAEIDCAA